MFEYFGLIAVGLSWLIGGLIIWKWRIDNTKSISEHAASHRTAFLLCGVVLSIIGPLFYLWILKYLVEPLELGSVFVAIMGLAIALQFATGLVPDVPGWKRKVHRFTAYGMAALFFPLAVMLTLHSGISTIAFVVGIGSVGYMVLGWFLFNFVPKSRENYLIFQSLYIIVFQLQILAVAYTR